MMRTIKRITDIVTTVLVAVVVVIAAGLLIARFFGIRAFTVLSGSMEPTYHVGSLVFVRQVDPLGIEPGDTITYLVADNTVVTHRCVEVLPDDEDSSVVRFRTKGDANNVEDASLVHGNNLIGKPVISVPLIGYAVNYIQHPPGTYIAVAIVVIVVLFVFWPDKREEKKKKLREQVSEDNEQNENEDKK